MSRRRWLLATHLQIFPTMSQPNGLQAHASSHSRFFSSLSCRQTKFLLNRGTPTIQINKPPSHTTPRLSNHFLFGRLPFQFLLSLGQLDQCKQAHELTMTPSFVPLTFQKFTHSTPIQPAYPPSKPSINVTHLCNAHTELPTNQQYVPSLVSPTAFIQVDPCQSAYISSTYPQEVIESYEHTHTHTFLCFRTFSFFAAITLPPSCALQQHLQQLNHEVANASCSQMEIDRKSVV